MARINPGARYITGGFRMELIIQLISGAIGGNVAGGVMKQHSLGTVGNSIAGILGGGIGDNCLARSPGWEVAAEWTPAPSCPRSLAAA